MAGFVSDLHFVGAIFKNLTAFYDKKPIVVDIPDETTVVDLTQYDLGTVRVTESKGQVTIQKIT